MTSFISSDWLAKVNGLLNYLERSNLLSISILDITFLIKPQKVQIDQSLREMYPIKYINTRCYFLVKPKRVQTDQPLEISNLLSIPILDIIFSLNPKW